jgi:hypothetical protein
MASRAASGGLTPAVVGQLDVGGLSEPDAFLLGVGFGVAYQLQRGLLRAFVE